MPKYVKISPLARVGGQIGITARINSNRVSAAYSHGDMFRGIEKVLVVGSQGGSHGRDVRDAPVITSRTCGLCHFTHRHASLRNIESAAGFTFPFAQAADAGYSSDTINSGDVPGSLYDDSSSGNEHRWLGPGRNKRRTANPTTDLSGIADYSSAKKIPVGAQLARNIVQIVTTIYSHLVHSVMLAGPDYKKLIDNWIQTNSLSDCNIHTNETSGSESFFDNIYRETVVAQRILHEILGFLGGKAPHQMSAIPGGFSRSFTTTPAQTGTDIGVIKVLATKTIGYGGSDPNSPTYSLSWSLLDFSSWDQYYELDNANLKQGNDWICKRFSAFIVALAHVLQNIGADNWGVGPGKFICGGALDIVEEAWFGSADKVTGDQYFRAGVYLGSMNRKMLDPTQEIPDNSTWRTIHEDIVSGKYPEPDQYTEKPVCGGYPGEAETQPLVADDPSRYIYTWSKAARVRDNSDPFVLEAVESGPLARLVVNGVDPDLNGAHGYSLDRASLFYDAWKSSTANRLYARLQEMLMLIDMLIGSNYSGENENNGYLKEIYNNKGIIRRLHRYIYDQDGGSGGGPLWTLPGTEVYSDPVKAWETLNGVESCAILDGPRGASAHFCRVDNGKLSQYQLLSGTTWNSSGRDSQGNPDPIEWSLMGMKKEETDVTLSQSGLTWTTTSLTAPVCERTLLIKYELKEGPNWREYTAIDVPKHNGSEEGQIVGEGLKATSKIDYTTGVLTLEFKDNTAGNNYMQNVKVDQYGYAARGVFAPAEWDETGYTGYGYGYDTSDPGNPNPINIMRTVRSFDPCNNCGVH